MAKALRGSAYWRGRLEREHPEIARRLRSGEIRSVRAAAIEAGLIRERKPLDDLRRAWAKAARGERRAFLAEVGATESAIILGEIERRHEEVDGLQRYSPGTVDLSSLEE